MAVKSYKYVGDFETTTDPKDVRVWATCLVNIESLECDHIDNNIESMFNFLKNKNSVVYFHNLKFDGEFILHYLLTHGFKYSEEPKDQTFSALITDEGVFYSITVIFEKKNKKYKKVVFRDSLKKLPFKVSVISKAFDLPDDKLDIDYKAFRPVGHVLTEEERQYIINDCRIVAGALKIQFEKGLTKLTNASDSMSWYKNIIAGRFEKWYPVFPVQLDSDIRQAYKGGFTYLNPIFRNKRIPGGITLDINSLYPWAMFHGLLPYGYPMFFEGEPNPDERYPLYIVHLKCGFDLKPGHIPTIQIKNSRRFVETEYLTSSNGQDDVELFLTNVDFELFKDHYVIHNPEYINGWKFKGAHGMFKDYIDYWMNIKETSTGAIRQLAKLMLNSLYGRFAMNPKAYTRVAYLDENEIVRYEVIDSEEKAKKHGVKPPKLRDPVYTAMGCFITAYAREKTIRSAQSVFDRFIYADTDSLHLVGEEIPEGLDIHPTKLGAWKHEGTFVDSLYVRSKTYIETMREPVKASLRNYARDLNEGLDITREGSSIRYADSLRNYAKLLNRSADLIRWDGAIYPVDMKVTCAGMPDNVKESVTYENFHSGATFDGKLMPRRFRGGIVLMETTFTIL